MKRLLAYFLLTLLCCFLLTTGLTTTADEENTVLGDEAIVDNLTDAADVNWYSFTLPEKGMAVIAIQSLQEHWNGYKYNWHAAVYAADKTTIIKEVGVEGYTYTTRLATGMLEAGDYYLRIGAVKSSNPLMAGFTDKNYSITTTIAYASMKNEGPAGKTKTVSKAGEIICAIDGEIFIKCNDGKAVAGLYRNKKGAIVPMLVSKEEAAVSYVVMSTGAVVEGWSTPTKEGYYYSQADSIENYSAERGFYQTDDLPLYFTDTQSQACADVADAILEQQQVEKAGGQGARFFQKHGKTLLIVLGVIAALVLYVIFWNRASGGTSSTGSSSSSSSYSGSSGGSYSGSSTINNPTWQDIDDMQTAQAIAERLRDPSYDPESFSSIKDPESFSSIPDTESFGPPCDY